MRQPVPKLEICGDGVAFSDAPAHESGMYVDVVEKLEPDTEFKELLSVLQREERAQVAKANEDILAIVKSLGGDRGRYKRERARALRAVVSEIYSPPRV